MGDPTHFDSEGRVHMVDVSHKPETKRRAAAGCRVRMGSEAAEALRSGGAKKGDVLHTAQLAGIQAAKRTADLIPLCHTIRTTSISVEFDFEDETTLGIRAEAMAVDRTGVEMEAMVAASTAALTVYDMLKAVDRSIEVTDLRLLSKSGGKTGVWERPA